MECISYYDIYLLRYTRIFLPGILGSAAIDISVALHSRKGSRQRTRQRASQIQNIAVDVVHKKTEQHQTYQTKTEQQQTQQHRLTSQTIRSTSVDAIDKEHSTGHRRQPTEQQMSQTRNTAAAVMYQANSSKRHRQESQRQTSFPRTTLVHITDKEHSSKRRRQETRHQTLTEAQKQAPQTRNTAVDVDTEHSSTRQ